MKTRFKNFFWALKIALKNNKLLLILYLIIRFAAVTLGLLLALLLSYVLDSITSSITVGGDLSEYIWLLVELVVGLFLPYIIMMLRWRVNLRVIPMYSDLKIQTFIFKIYQRVPYKLLSQEEFIRDFNDAELLIMDEPTAALDPEAETDLYNNIINDFADKGMIMVSHRLGFMNHLDKIIVMKKGKIVDVGSHAELLSRCDYYREMYTSFEQYYNKDKEKAYRIIDTGGLNGRVPQAELITDAAR